MVAFIKSIFFIFLFPFMAFAEYNGHQIEFSLVLTDGSTIHGYKFLPVIYNNDKTVDYKAYLEAHVELVLLNQLIDAKEGELSYFQNRIKYNYTDFQGGKHFIYTLTDEKRILREKIKTFKIEGLTNQSYAIGISSEHKFEDESWMNSKPLIKLSYGGVFCSHDIFIHEKNKEIDKIIAELESETNMFSDRIKQLEADMETSDGEPYYEAKDKIKKIEEEIDEKIADLLVRFNNLKVVVITMCTC